MTRVTRKGYLRYLVGARAFISHVIILSLFFSSVQWGFISAAYANPDGGTVVGGSAAISGQGTSHVIVNQGSNRAAINWNNFSVGQGERTQFVQPNKNSITFNRVTGGNASQILGSVDANGKIIIANPNGIVFGAGSKVDAAGLVATTHDMNTNDFMSGGNLRFNKSPNAAPGASVVNEGEITIRDAGVAALVAPSVRNGGMIVADGGAVSLGAGNGFALDLNGNSLISFQVGDEISNTVTDANGNPVKALVENNGTIQANGGKILLTAKAARDIVNQTVNVGGVLKASSVTQKGGEIILSSTNAAGKASGKVIVENASIKSTGQTTGGTVQVVGEHVNVKNSTVDVSGKTGGGTVRIGGGWQGGEGLARATTTTVDKNTTIKADATSKGNGGSIVLWSDVYTDYTGHLTAKGGLSGGNGGKAEVSGKDVLNFAGTIDLLAPKGKAGSLLLDPQNITIVSGAASPGVTCTDGVCLPDGDSSYMKAGDLQAALGNGNVEISTGSNGAEAGDIIFDADVTWGSAYLLMVNAYRDITINPGVTIKNKYSGAASTMGEIPVLLALRADALGTGTGSVTNNGTIDFSQSNGAVSMFYSTAVTEGSYAANVGWTEPANHSLHSQFMSYKLINSEADLLAINGISGVYAFGQDIDGHGHSFNSDTPIAQLKNSILDGQYCYLMTGAVCGVKNYKMGPNASMTSVGLFQDINANSIARNFSVDINITHNYTSNGTTYASGGLTAALEGIVANVIAYGDTYFTYDYAVKGINMSAYVGGLVGHVNDAAAAIYSSESYGEVRATSMAAGTVVLNLYQGGLVGYQQLGKIWNSSNFGDVNFIYQGLSSADQWVITGGLLGYNRSSVGGSVYQSSSIGDVAATYYSGYVATGQVVQSYIGGLIGINDTAARVSQSFSGGSVYNEMSKSAGTEYTGGFVGYNKGSITDAYSVAPVTYKKSSASILTDMYAGGFVGNNTGTIDNAFATGYLGATTGGTTGGFAGRLAGTMNKVYYDKGTSGTSADAMAVPKSSLQSSVIGLGYSASIWGMVSGKSYAYFLWQVGGDSHIEPYIVSGTASASYGGSALSGVEVASKMNGSAFQSWYSMDSMHTGADGYYYYLLAPGTLSGSGDQMVTYLTASRGEAFQNNMTANSASLDIYGNFLHVKSDLSGSFSSIMANLATGLGSTNGISVNYDITGGAMSMSSGYSMDIDFADAGAASIDRAITLANGNLHIGSAGTVTQSSALSASGLLVDGGGNFTLTNASNDISYLAGSANLLNLREQDGFEIGTVSNYAGINGSNLYITEDGGNVTQTAAMTGYSGLLLQGIGTANFTLTNSSNAITTLAASGVTTLSFLENSGFSIGAVNSVNGISATSLYLSSTGTVTQAQAISATNLLLQSSGTYTLTNTSNAITTLASSGTGTRNFVENSGFDIGTVNSVNGLTSTFAYLSSTGTVTQSQLIAATSLSLAGAAGVYTLTNTSNAITTLSANTGTVNFLENSGFAIGTVNSVVGLTATNAYLSSTGTVTQSQLIAATNLLLQSTGTYTLTNTSNAITTLAASGTSTVNFLENSGFDIGTVNSVNGLTATSAYLSSTGTVTQSQALAATNLLLQSSGTYTLTNTSNAITTLAASGTSTVDFLENSGFIIGTVNSVNGLTATNAYLSSSSVSVGQAQPITVTSLLLRGSGTYGFTGNSSNAITTLAASGTGTIHFWEDSGFDIGTVNGVNGLTASVASLTSAATVTQSQAITTPDLSLTTSGAGSVFTLLNTGNAITTLAGSGTGTINFLENSGFDIGSAGPSIGLAGTSVYLSSTGAVTQSQRISATNLLLQGAGSTYTLTDTSNAITTLAASGPSTVNFLENSGFDIGTVNSVNGLTSTNAYLSSTGTVTQSQLISATNLLLQSSGTYTLTNTSNAITTLAASGTSTVNFLENSGFDIGTVNSVNGLTAANAYLSSTGTVTQSQAIAATNLLLQGTGATYTLINTGNAITTLASSGTGTREFLENSGFDIGTVNSVNGLTATSAYLSSTGTVTQSQRINATNLLLQGAGSTYTLTNGSNAITTLAANGPSTVNFLENSGFAIGTVNSVNGVTATSAYLSSTGTVTQSQALAVTFLVLQGSGGVYTLTNSGNATGGLVANTGTVDFRDDSGFTISTINGVSGITATNVYLTTAGTVTQNATRQISATNLLLQGSGTYNLTESTNAITTLAASGTSTVNFLENSGFAIGTVNSVVGLTATDAYLSSTGTVTQSQRISATNLLLQSSGTYTLTNGSNAITTLAASGTSTVNFLENSGFAIGTVNSVNGLTATNAYLSSTGTVTQSQAIAATNLLLQGTGGTYTLNDTSNAITTLASSGTGTREFLENSGFDIGTVNSVNGLTATNAYLSSTGTVTQSQAIVANKLLMAGTGGRYTLTNTGNAVATIASNTDRVDYLNNSSFAIGTVNSVLGLTADKIYLSSTGTVTQLQPIIADELLLQGAAAIYTLTNTHNNVTKLAGNTTGTIEFTENDGFTIGVVNGVQGVTAANLYLSSTAAVTQGKAITATKLLLAGGTGTYVLNDTDNAITTLAADATTVRFKENTGYSIGVIASTLGTTLGVTASNAYLSSTGTVTQVRALDVGDLELSGGTGTWNLDQLDNNVGVLAGNATTIKLLTTGSVIGAVNVTTGVTATNFYLTSDGSVTQTEAIAATNLSLAGAAGVYTLTNTSNAITTLSADTDTVNFVENSGFVIGTVNGVNGLTAANAYLSSTGTVTQSQAVTAANLLLAGAGGIYTLTDTDNDIDTLAANTATVNVAESDGLTIGTVNGTNGVTTTAKTTVVTDAGIVLARDISANGAGTTITLSGASFDNSANAGLNAGTGRFLVWSEDPANDDRGGIAHDFKHYNATYGVTDVSGITGDGFLYTLAPTLSVALQGAVNKVYNGTNVATLGAGNYDVTGEVDGDTVVLDYPTSGTYSNKNVGTGKNVAVTGIAVDSVTNGAVTVYGYTLNNTTANANIGAITAKALTIGSFTTADKIYNGSTAAVISSYAFSGAVGGDALSMTGLAGAFGDDAVGNNKTVSLTSGNLAGGDAGNYNFTLGAATALADILSDGSAPPPAEPPKKEVQQAIHTMSDYQNIMRDEEVSSAEVVHIEKEKVARAEEKEEPAAEAVVNGEGVCQQNVNQSSDGEENAVIDLFCSGGAKQ